MALARGLMLKGSSGSSTESDSPQMYTCMRHRLLRHTHRTSCVYYLPLDILALFARVACMQGVKRGLVTSGVQTYSAIWTRVHFWICVLACSPGRCVSSLEQCPLLLQKPIHTALLAPGSPTFIMCTHAAQAVLYSR